MKTDSGTRRGFETRMVQVVFPTSHREIFSANLNQKKKALSVRRWITIRPQYPQRCQEGRYRGSRVEKPQISSAKTPNYRTLS